MMEIKLEKVTPAKAGSWLNRNTSNRKLREGVAEAYADDMRNGRWTECLDPIAFYDNGENAISYFMRRKPLSVIKAVKDEMYPKPRRKKDV